MSNDIPVPHWNRPALQRDCGSRLRARTLPAQKTEARVGCSVLNRMTRLGMPAPQRVC